MGNVNQKSSLHSIFLLFLYKTVLDCSYVFVISPLYLNSGLATHMNPIKLFLSDCATVFLFNIMDRGKEKVSSIILQYHFIIMIIPLLSYYALNDQSTTFVFMITICFVLEIVLLRLLPNFRIIRISQLESVLSFLLPLFLLGVILVMFYYNGLSLGAVNFNAAHALRKNQQVPFRAFVYLWTWCYRIINPLFIVMMYLKGKKVLMSCFLCLQLLMYLISPHKEIFFAPLLILGCLYFLKQFNFANSILGGASAVIALFVAIYFFTGQVMPIAIVPDRLMIIPAQVKFEHFEYFSQFPKLHFSEGLIGKFLNIPYAYGDLSSGNVISLYFHGSNSNSNTGYLAYAFDNLGFMGMLLSSFLFVAIMKFFDSLTTLIHTNIITALCIYPLALLNDGDILTMLLTGGLFLLILILPLYSDLLKQDVKISNSPQFQRGESRYFKTSSAPPIYAGMQPSPSKYIK